MKKYGLKHVKATLCLLFFSMISYGALPDFTLFVTKTNETCPGNGALTFMAFNTAQGSEVVFTIFYLPDAINPIATQNENTLGGLVAGDYRIIATQTLGDESNFVSQDVTILNNIVSLQYNLSGEHVVCGADGKITVGITQGSAISFEIIAGPVLRPLQVSNVFDMLPVGYYQVRAFNPCGIGVVHDFTLISMPHVVLISHENMVMEGCDTVHVSDKINSVPGGVIAYPLSVEYTFNPPSGPPQVFTEIIDSGGASLEALSYTFSFIYNQPYSYTVKVTDNCGSVYTGNPVTFTPLLYAIMQTEPLGCNDLKLKVLAGGFSGLPFTVNFVSAPEGFDPAILNFGHPGPFSTNLIEYYNPSVPLPEGLYEIELTDACGHTATDSIEVVELPPIVNPISVTLWPGCELGMGTLQLYKNTGSFASAMLMQAPAAYPHALPYDISGFISGGNYIRMDSLPGGTYVFKTLTDCNVEQNTTVTVIGYEITSNVVAVIEGCNVFNVQLANESNSQDPKFWLQEKNELGQWVHPQTGQVGGNFIGPANAQALSNNMLNINLPFTGILRIVKTFNVFSESPGNPIETCTEELLQFTYIGVPAIIDVFPFACSDGATDVFVEATGAMPITYRITEKNGMPFEFDNGTSALFIGLEPAIYKFEVEDDCGNILQQLYDINEPVSLSVTPVDLCQGQPGTLRLPVMDFLEYTWWKGNDEANVLSNTNVLSFPVFDPETDSGLYHVRVLYPNANSCIDFVLDFELSPDLADPNAGIDILNSYCGNQGVVNLFDILPGEYDDFGTWTETTSSGTLTSSHWDSSDVPPGTYVFKYRVDGLCGIFDESEMTLVIYDIPETPEAFLEQLPCNGQTLHLLATAIPDATYSWTGPNGFTSNEQNPIIENLSSANNGTYNVEASNGICTSGIGSVEVVVFPSPEFTIAQACIDNAYTLTATWSGTTDQIDFNYSWAGPENFSATGNPVDISGQPRGTYTLLVTLANDCPSAQSIEVPTTQCNIPKGVSPDGNGRNDTFNLAGFAIKTVKIFNRYGIKVYEKDGYVNEWKGQDNKGRELPSATYYYLIELESGQSKTGWVYLQRKDN